MPRLPRIEFKGASYHVTAHGFDGDSIVFSDHDRQTFCRTLAETMEKTGWEVFCWILMDNHYHIVIRTPKANLVAGMSWFQKVFTQRINTNNNTVGPLFDGRYKAILVENDTKSSTLNRSDYLANLIEYVHLNPGRDRVVDGKKKSVGDYQWSSLSQWFTIPPSKRPAGAQVSQALDVLGFKDTAAGRRRYISELDESIRNEDDVEALGFKLPEGQSFQSTLERGWYWGSKSFREEILVRFSHIFDPNSKPKNTTSRNLAQDHSEKRAKAILKLGKEILGVKKIELVAVDRSDLRRSAIASALAEQTTLSQQRIADLLNMKSPGNVAYQIVKFRSTAESELDLKTKQFIKKSRLIS